MSDPAHRWDGYVDHIKLTEAHLTELMEMRRRRPSGGGSSHDRPAFEKGGADPRQYRRIRVRGALWVPAEIREPNGTTRKFKVYPVDIASGGMCFFTGMFVHAGSVCTLTLHMPDNELITVEGTAVRCALLEGRVHEVGVSFNSPLDMAMLAPEVEARSMSPAAPPPGDSGPKRSAEAAMSGPAIGAGASASPSDSGRDIETSDGATRHGPDEVGAMLPAIGVELKALADQLSGVTDLAGRIRAIGVMIDAACKPGASTAAGSAR